MTVDDIKLLVGLAIAVATFFIGRMTAAKQDGREMGRIEEKLDNISAAVQKIERGSDTASETARTALDLARRCNTRLDDIEKHFLSIGAIRKKE